MANNVTVSNSPLTDYPVKTTEESGKHIQHIIAYSALVPKQYDELVLGYTGSNLTSVVYKFQTATVATLTLGYTGSDLTSVVKT